MVVGFNNKQHSTRLLQLSCHLLGTLFLPRHNPLFYSAQILLLLRSSELNAT